MAAGIWGLDCLQAPVGRRIAFRSDFLRSQTRPANKPADSTNHHGAHPFQAVSSSASSPPLAERSIATCPPVSVLRFVFGLLAALQQALWCPIVQARRLIRRPDSTHLSCAYCITHCPSTSTVLLLLWPCLILALSLSPPSHPEKGRQTLTNPALHRIYTTSAVKRSSPT